MSQKRVQIGIWMISILLLVLGLGPGARALISPQAPDAPGLTIPYAGHLTDDAGRPVADGPYDLVFTLYAEPVRGAPLWSEMQTRAMVHNGAFALELGSVNRIPLQTLGGEDRWLAVSVRGPGEATFTPLNPRQRVSAGDSTMAASPSTGIACPHDHFGEQWIGTGADGLLISTDSYVALTAYSGNYIGVAGISTPYSLVWPSDREYGVFGYSYSDHGVYGQTNSDWNYHSGVYGEATKDHANGVTGWNTAAGPGVYGYSELGPALYAKQMGDPTPTSGEVAAVIYSQYGDGLWATSAEENGWAAKFQDNVWVFGYLSKGAGGFKIDHPLDPENQYLYHSFVESPDMKNLYDGVVVLEADGAAWVELPAWFQALNQEFRYQLTCIGGFVPVYIAREIEDNRFQIAGGEPGMKVSWQVTGIRHDPYAEAHRISVEEEKLGAERGLYIHPEEYGQPSTLGIESLQNRVAGMEKEQ